MHTQLQQVASGNQTSRKQAFFFFPLWCFLWFSSSRKGDSSIPSDVTLGDCQLVPSPRAVGDGVTGFLLKTSPALCFLSLPSLTIRLLVPRTIAHLLLSSARNKEKPCAGSMPSAPSVTPSQTSSSKSPVPVPGHKADQLRHACPRVQETEPWSNQVTQIKVCN